MNHPEKFLSWVVYRMTLHGKVCGMSAVCEQGEWEVMERIKPGYHTLVQAGIANEGEAERLARSVAADLCKPNLSSTAAPGMLVP